MVDARSRAAHVHVHERRRAEEAVAAGRQARAEGPRHQPDLSGAAAGRLALATSSFAGSAQGMLRLHTEVNKTPQAL